MKGFLLGVLLTLIVGGVFYYLQVTYRTLDACVAIETTLTEGVKASLEHDLSQRTNSPAASKMVTAVLEPVADPLIANEVRQETKGRNWFQCAVELVKLDVLGTRSERIAVIKQRLLPSLPKKK
jgi:hypothetical protein